MEIYSVEHWQENWDELMARVEMGERIGVTNGKNCGVTNGENGCSETHHSG